jgi:hypothetical protein
MFLIHFQLSGCPIGLGLEVSLSILVLHKVDFYCLFTLLPWPSSSVRQDTQGQGLNFGSQRCGFLNDPAPPPAVVDLWWSGLVQIVFLPLSQECAILFSSFFLSDGSFYLCPKNKSMLSFPSNLRLFVHRDKGFGWVLCFFCGIKCC